ncbi:hypothetical protein ACH5RR_040932 [Cinchona calisaya]|uniref:Uncharacterized protein n=1 Tax=Cinchona calisaya TaxID=153742 RepID=A0ABD2XVJ0_9GENT
MLFCWYNGMPKTQHEEEYWTSLKLYEPRLTNDESWSDDEIYPKDDSEQKEIQNKSFYDYPIEDDEEIKDRSDDNKAPFRMGNSKQSDGNSVPKDPMLVNLNQPLEEKDTIVARARMWTPTLERIWDDKFEDELNADPALFVKTLFDLSDAFEFLEIRVEDLEYGSMKKDKASASTIQLPQQDTTENLRDIIKKVEV